MNSSTELQVKNYMRKFRTLELTKRGMERVALFLSALLGYGLGGSLVVVAILKSIFPDQTGLWVGKGVFYFGIYQQRNSPPVHDVSIPVALCLGCFFVWLTTHAIRRFLGGTKQCNSISA
jgi:hypothetical protein